MAYDIARLTADDPTYGPGLIRSKDKFYWRPSKTYVRLGHPKEFVPLTGTDDERRAEARALTRAMLERYNGKDLGLKTGTWRWLITRYLTDEFSPFQEVKANTQKSYRQELKLWTDKIGDLIMADTELPHLKAWQRDLQKVSAGHAQRHFGRLRTVVSYGVQLKAPGAIDLKAVLSEIRVKGSKPRQVAPVGSEIMDIVAAADRAGETTWATGILCQWWLTLRAVDVRGQFIEGRWADGMTWDMLDRDMTVLRKVPSKTERSMPEVLEFDLTLVPELRERLAAIGRGVGPVFTHGGMPFTTDRWSRLFRRFRKEAGVRDDLWMMDTRAGAINHARRAGASPYEMRAQANHASLSTTDRYVRERSDTANSVIKMRTGK